MTLELADIQAGVIRPRPTPYAATYILLRIDDPAAGRVLLRRLVEVVPSSATVDQRPDRAWVSVALTFWGLQALGVPANALQSFSWEFQQGMVARARALGDVGENGPEHWERPLGSKDVHVVVVIVGRSRAMLDQELARARVAIHETPGIEPVWRQDCQALPSETEPFGFRDGINHPAFEGGIPSVAPHEAPLAPGEFVLGYPNELGGLGSVPQPDVLGRNGTYVVFRKLHQRVAAFRRYLRDNARSPEDEELIAAKMMGRWRSGAPLARCPFHDDPSLGADKTRNSDFTYADDPIGYSTPLGSHIRRTNPRDSTNVAGVVRLHRMIRRGTVYGPELAPGVLEDDGVDRGLMFAFIGAHLGRQFEFVQSEWVNSGESLGLERAMDPMIGPNDGTGTFSIPNRPVPRRLRGLSSFVVNRGGEYCFLPGLRALRWLSEGKF